MTFSFYISIIDNIHLMEGNCINLPPFVLEKYNEENKEFPFFFSIKTSYHKCYVGVCEFTSEDYQIQISPNLAEELILEENQIVEVELVENVPFAKFLRLEPMEKEFFQIEDYDTVLEEKLSKFAVMYPQQIISFSYENKVYRLLIKDIEPDWDSINLEEVDDYHVQCFNIRNQDIEVEIQNRFLKEELLRKKNELMKEEEERLEMKKNDINSLHQGQRLSNSFHERLSVEEIRKKRLKRFQK